MVLLTSTGDGQSTRMVLVTWTLSSGLVSFPSECSMPLSFSAETFTLKQRVHV